MGLEWVFLVRGDTGSYHIIVWIVSYYRMDRIVLDGLDRIVSAGSRNAGFYVLSGYCLDGMDGTDGMDGALAGGGWMDGR